MILAGVAIGLVKLGAVDEALAVAAKVRPPARSVDVTVEVLFRAERFREMRVVLKKVSEPAAAAKLAWSITRMTLGLD